MKMNNGILGMRYIILVAAVILVSSCEGKLTDEQRKKMREQMELHKIKKVTELEITEAAYAEGRRITSILEKLGSDSLRIDSVRRAMNGSVRFLKPGQGNAQVLEEQLIEAYLADESGSMQDNIQRTRKGNQPADSILYTKPVVKKNSDGSEELIGVCNIWLSQKALIIAMDK